MHAIQNVSWGMRGRHVGGDVRHVIWDWNGTLLNDVEHCISIINGMLRDAGLEELGLARYHDVFDFPVRRYYERIGFDLTAGRWERLADRFIGEYDRGVRSCDLHFGAERILNGLRASNVGCSVLSAARTDSIDDILRHRGLRDLVGDVVGLDDHYAHGKEAIGIEWMQRTAIDPDTTVFIGDTTHDYDVARAMGVPCVLVGGGHHALARLERCGCPVAGSLDDLFR